MPAKPTPRNRYLKDEAAQYATACAMLVQHAGANPGHHMAVCPHPTP
jgi:hypothetical protein